MSECSFAIHALLVMHWTAYTGAGTGEVQDEDASKLLRRLSSPIYNTGAFEEDSDAEGGEARTPGFLDDEAKDEATEKIQVKK